MKEFIKKFVLAQLLLILLSVPVMSVKALNLLNSETQQKLGSQESAFQKSAGYEDAYDTTAAEIIATVIRAFIGLLGIIFVILIVYSGYNWMTAAGDAAKITKAKDTITRAIIGLIIVLAAYSITYFVFSNLDSVVS